MTVNNLRWTNFVASAVFAIMMLGSGPVMAEIDATTLSKPKPVPEFSLEDHTGARFEKPQMVGRWSVMLTGFTHCPDVCPFTLQNMALVYEQMKSMMRPDSLPQILFLAVDPERDKENLGDYVKHFDQDFKGVTGIPEQLKILVEGTNGFYRLDKKSKDDKDYQVRHNGNAAIINPLGEVIATVNPPMDPTETARFIAGLMRDYKRAQTN